MVYQRRLLSLLTLFIVISLFVVACERPLGGTDEDTTNQNEQVDDPDVGGGVETGGDTGTTDGGTTDGGVTEGDTSGETAEEPAGDTSGDTAGETTDSGTGDTTTDTGGDTTTDSGGETQDDSAEAGGGVGDTTTDTGSETAAGDTTTDTGASETTTTTVPGSHTVAAGENLYRIGLKYGISWVAIANANNLTNPNILTVGQVLTLPGGNAPTPTPAPTPSPQTETTYVVQAGDNLYRIGLRFGISWVQIAEANGLVNPNMITVGSELKIPVNTPGPAPAFSHVVKPGETLFLISLQYGVAWPAIAEANNLTSPYVIYVGQTLQIPGS